MIKAVIFDIDGTLVDSVDLHARCWQQTFSHFGHEVAFEAVRSQIGKGGDQLMPVFLSKEEIEQHGEEIEDFRSTLFKEKYLPQVHGFAATRELLQRIKRNGQELALASSAKGDELATYKKIARIDELIDRETSSDDVEQSKPHPDIFEAALGRLGLDASEAITVGDSPYDAQAAAKSDCARLASSAAAFRNRICALPVVLRFTATRPICWRISPGRLLARMPHPRGAPEVSVLPRLSQRPV